MTEKLDEQAMKRSRAQLLDKWDALLATAEAEGRALDDAEQETVRRLEEGAKNLDTEIALHRLRRQRDAAGAVPSRGADSAVADWSRAVAGCSLVRALRQSAGLEKSDGLEAEVSSELARRMGRSATGIWFPLGEKALTSPDWSAGGLVPVGTGAMIDRLMSASIIPRLNTSVLQVGSGLGGITLPKLKTGVSGSWVGEGVTVPESQPTVGDVNFTARSLASYVSFSRELLAFSNASIESLLMNDVARSFAAAIDAALLNGSGVGNEPKGLLQHADLDVIETGQAPSWAKLLELESAPELLDAAADDMRFLAHPAVLRKLRQTLRVANDAGAGFVIDGDQPASLIGRPVVRSTAVPSGALVYGNWQSAVVAMWQGIDLLADPYSQARNGLVCLHGRQYCDVNFRHLESFAAIVSMTV